LARRALIAALLLSALAAGPLSAADFDAWVRSRGQVQIIGTPKEASLAVGSIQKPFLMRAWASAHLREATPRIMCTKTSGCWRPGGHGPLDLRGAIRESCNSYFRQIARETSSDAIRESFLDAGFSWAGEMSDAEAIGLPGPAAVTIAPERLLASYTELVRSPWISREDVRRELIEGMKESAFLGTASGLRLFGFMAKTGTVPALDGAPLQTSGFVVAVEDGGFAFLGLLRRGTGREAAIRAGDEIARLRTGLVRRSDPTSSSSKARPGDRKRGLEDLVRVRMLDELRLAEIRLQNIGTGPTDSSRGFIGPGGSTTAAPGDHFSAGEWRITAENPEFERRIRGAVAVLDQGGPIRLVATMSARDYANGVLKAELGTTAGVLRTQLASAALRYLQRGARHPEADVCDSTHCAWFVGEGPVPRWLRPDTARNERDIAADLSDSEWARALRDARAQPRGADLWTADCGGEPASPHFIWGGGDRRVTLCPRHPKGSGRHWRREWSAAALEAVFGTRPEAIDVAVLGGQWMLKVRLAPRESGRNSTSLTMTYDEAHRRLAEWLGWDAMPAPATRVSRTSSGFVVEGRGFGHRVGLCLAP
jgi:hypothetical protein